jgi:hypothetical protein
MKALERAKQVEVPAEGFWDWLLGGGGSTGTTG